MKHEYDVLKYTNGVYGLIRDDNTCRCPKSTISMPQINNVSQQVTMIPTQMTCCTLCPFAEFEEDEHGKKYTVSCEGAEKIFSISKVNEQPSEKKPAPILSLAPGD